MNEELAKLLEKEPDSDDPELLKLVLLLANKALDSQSLKKDENGALLVKTIDF